MLMEMEDNIKITPLTKNLLNESLNLMLDHFFYDETISKIIGLHKNRDAMKELLPIFTRIAEDGISLAAINERNEVISVLFNKKENIHNDDFFHEIMKHCTHEESKEFIHIMSSLSEHLNLFEYYKIDSYIEMMFTVTHLDYRGMGIYKKLTAIAVNQVNSLMKQQPQNDHEQFKKFLPKALCGVCTNAITRKICESHGLITIKKVKLSDLFVDRQNINEDNLVYFEAMLL